MNILHYGLLIHAKSIIDQEQKKYNINKLFNKTKTPNKY